MTKFLNISTDNTLGGSSASDVLVSSQKAIKDYIDTVREWYGTCSTAASTQTKVVDCTGFVLRTGVSIRVLFSKAQTYNGVPKLNVNSTGDIEIYYLGETAGTRYLWQSNELVSFTYDGSHWVMEDGGLATTTYYGYTKLSGNSASTSTSLAATPYAINLAMERTVTGYPSFSSSSTYAVGDRVRYNDGYMYECTTAVTTAGDWNASDWTVLPDLQTQLDDKVTKNSSAQAKAYGTTSAGVETAWKVSSSASASTLAYRGTNGVLQVGTPTADEHAATKKYVDDLIPTVNDATITITQGGVTKGSFTLNQSSAQTIALDAGGGGGGSSNIPYGTSDSAADATEKTVSIPEITALNAGQIIIVQPSITSTVADSTLKLNNFPAYPMIYAGSAITTSTDTYVWRANTPTTWRFDGTNWVFLAHGIDLNTTYTSMNTISDAGQYTAGSGTYAITRYSLIMQKADMTWEKITATNKTYTTGTTKSVNTNGFRLNQIRYYSTTTILATGDLSATNVVFSQAASVDMRYSTNCGGTTTWALGDYIYLVGTLGLDGLFYLDTTTWWTNTLPNTNDGKLYIRLGLVLVEEGYTMSFFADRPIFYHDGTTIREYNPAQSYHPEDNLTITENANQKIQAVAVIDQNTGIIKSWSGTGEEYEDISEIDPDTLYITDDIGLPATEIGQITEALNDKVDKGHQVIEFQEPTSANDYTWYRKYADGWIEQGGRFSGYEVAITLPIVMNDANYNIQTTGTNEVGGGGYQTVFYINQTTTGFSIASAYGGNWYSNSGYWQVSGIAA